MSITPTGRPITPTDMPQHPDMRLLSGYSCGGFSIREIGLVWDEASKDAVHGPPEERYLRVECPPGVLPDGRLAWIYAGEPVADLLARKLEATYQAAMSGNMHTNAEAA